MSLKTALTPSEKVSAAFHVLVRGIPTQDVASMLGVNYGRVSEACADIKAAAGYPKAAKGDDDA